jgi:hypothetical protein
MSVWVYECIKNMVSSADNRIFMYLFIYSFASFHLKQKNKNKKNQTQ